MRISGDMTFVHKIDGDIDGALIPVEKHAKYNGTYSITPTDEDQTVECADLIMQEDLTVEAVPYAEVSNPAGGYTVTILS